MTLEHSLTFRTLDEMIRQRGDSLYGKFKTNEGWHAISWAQFRSGYLGVAALLRRLHPQGTPVVGILANTRLEWNLCDFATLALGGIVVGFYGNDRDAVMRHILEVAKPNILIVENEHFLQRLQSLDASWGRTRPVVIMEGTAADMPALHSLQDQLNATLDPPTLDALERGIRQLQGDQIASYIFTSGTSGLPKAAVLTQENLFHTAAVYHRHYPLSDTDTSLLYLPFAHVFARVMYYAGIHWGIVPHYTRRIEELVEDFPVIHPSVVLVVPRLLEKVRAKVLAKVAASGRFSCLLFAWATRVGRRYYVEKRRDAWTLAQLPLARKLVLQKVAGLFGERLRFLGCGGGHLPQGVAEFFQQLGIPVYEGYATTESGGLGLFNYPGNAQLGSVGQAVPELEVKLAEDGEILLRSDSVFQGYLKDSEATAAVLQDGWLHTGDVGMMDPNGFLTVVDRKKDLFVTAYGKNIAPTYIEEQLLASPAIEDAVVCGDGAPYLVALIVPSEAWLARYRQGLQDPDLYRGIEAELQRVNLRLSRHETIRHFCLVPFFDIASGTVTSTFKKRRKAIHERYRGEIAALYETGAVADGRAPLATVS